MQSRFLVLIVSGIVFFSGLLPAFAKVSPKDYLDFRYGFEQERIMYYVNTTRAQDFFRRYADRIDIIAPQNYEVTSTGLVVGTVSPELLSIARKNHVQVMPLIYNAGFSLEGITILLNHPDRQTRVANALVREAIKNGYVGWQLDIEHVPAKYRDKYTAFVTHVCDLFHQNNLLCSVAVVAQTSANPNDYPIGSWNLWAGVYDYHALGQSADFLSIMSYDDPTSTGPVAGITWYQEVLDYTMKLVPAQKISFGMPLYAWEWNEPATKRTAVRTNTLVANLLSTKTYLSKGRDDTELVPWLLYKTEGEKRRVWYEDASSVRAKLDLIKEYNIRGFSGWVLGVEDEKIWTDLLDR